MTATAHALAGAVIVSQIHNPAISLPLAFGSHIVMDLVPHWDAATHWREKSKIRLIIEAGVDVLLGIVLSFFLFGKLVNLPLLAAGVLMAQLPDWLEAPYVFFGWRFFPFNYIYKIQSKFHFRKDRPWGLINQIVFVTALIILTVNFGPSFR